MEVNVLTVRVRLKRYLTVGDLSGNDSTLQSQGTVTSVSDATEITHPHFLNFSHVNEKCQNSSEPPSGLAAENWSILQWPESVLVKFSGVCVFGGVIECARFSAAVFPSGEGEESFM